MITERLRSYTKYSPSISLYASSVVPNINIVAANIGARSIRHFKYVNVWPTLLRFRTTNRNCNCERKQVVHHLCYDVSIKLAISFDTTVLYIGEMLKCVWSVESIYVCFFSLLKRVLVGIWTSEDKKNSEKKNRIRTLTPWKGTR